jgi:hypothetical protein
MAPEENGSNSTPRTKETERLVELIGREPDPERDRASLELLESAADPAVDALVAHLCADRKLCVWPIGTLMPGLAAAKGSLSEGCFSTRVVNVLGRAGMRAWADLAAESAESLLLLPNFGPNCLSEVFAVAAREWAGTVLCRDGPDAQTEEEAPARGWQLNGDLAGAFQELEANARAFEIFKRRLLAPEERPSLRELGAAIGVSGERVRQREHAVEDAIAERMQDPAWPLRAAVGQLTEKLGSLARSERLPAVLAELDPDGCVFAAPHRQALLLRLAAYELCGEWVFRVDLDRRTDSLLEALTERGGPATIEECSWALDALDVPSGLRLPWIASRPGMQVMGGLVARKSQAMEVAIEVLGAAGEPLEIAELFERTEPPYSLATFRSHLLHDDRFARQGVRRYGLSEWQGELYTTLCEKMREEIERHGGAMDLDLLALTMAERFGVTEGSVLHRARTPQFEVDSSGLISRCIAPRVIPPATLALTHGCFRLEAGWAMRQRVTRTLLGGATVRMPLAFARELGLQFGTSQIVMCATGELHAHWPRYESSVAHLSSLRAVAEKHGAEEGDDLFAVHSGKDWLDFLLIEKRRRDEASGTARLALECGREPGREPIRQVLAALGFDPNLSSAGLAICSRLEERHERNLAEECLSSQAELLKRGYV